VSGNRVESLALLIRALEGGGMQRSLLLLAGAFAAEGARVEVLCADMRGEMGRRMPPGVHVRVLPRANAIASRLALLRARPGSVRSVLPLLVPPMPRMMRRVLGLASYLREQRPDALLSLGTQSNFAAILARELAAVPVRVVVSERNTLSVVVRHARAPFRKAYPRLIHALYPAADAIVAVSRGVAHDLAMQAAIPEDRVTPICNGLDARSITELSMQPVDDPWLTNDACPFVLGVGRLHRQKDFATLLRAFAVVQQRRALRLVILGEGPERYALERLARELGVGDKVRMPGFAGAPAAWMRRAAVFVLSSAWEGFPNVVLEALAAGCPVVSTDCPSGPREILADGAYGPLVPVGDHAAMASAILATIAAPLPGSQLRARAAEFPLSATVAGYRRVLEGPRVVAASQVG
jgi:glycosyltransferase involved in cell wall biosynthesis